MRARIRTEGADLLARVPGPDSSAAGNGSGELPLALTVLGSAILLGWLAASQPDLFLIEFSLRPLHLAAGAGLLALSVAILRWPHAALVLLVVVVYLNLSQLLARFHGLPSVLQFLFLPFLGAGLLSRERTGLLAVLTAPLTLLLAAYCTVLLVSTSVAWRPEAADARLIEVGKAFLLYLVVALLASTRRRIRWAAWTLVGCGTLLAALGIYQAATGDFGQTFAGLARFKMAHIHGSTFAPRIAGPVGDPNYLAQILLAPLAVALLLSMWSPRRPARAVAFAASALLLGGIALTYSRGAALAVGLIVVLVVALRGFRRGDLALTAGILLLLTLFSPQGFKERLTSLEHFVSTDGSAPLRLESSFQERRLLTLTAWRMFADHPALGVGAGNYAARFDEFAERVGSSAPDYADPNLPRYPHNLYLEIGAETGVPGLLAFLASLGAALLVLQRTRRRASRGDGEEEGNASLQAIAVGLQVGIAAYLTSSLFLHGAFQRYLWLLLGMTAAMGALQWPGAQGAGRAAGPAAPARTGEV